MSPREICKIGQKPSGVSQLGENALPTTLKFAACLPLRLSLFESDGAFERYLGFEAGKIPADCCNRQFLAAAAIADRAITRVETALDFRLVPAFGMPYVGNLQIVLFGPKEGDGVESFAC